ncbi:MAG: hypothetical protein ACLPT6_04910 [Desulfobaccales bacterium]
MQKVMEEETKRLLALDPKGETFKAEVQKIQEAKLKQVIDLIAAMVPCLAAFQFFKFGGYERFINAVEEIKTTWIRNYSYEELAEHTFLTPDVKDNFPDIIKLMSSLNYSPPSHEVDILYHLGALKYYYKKDINIHPTIVDMRIDLSFCKLLAKGYQCCETYKKLGIRELERIDKSIKSLGEKVNRKKGIVLEIYHRSQLIKPGMKLNAVINIIKKSFKKAQEEGTELEGLGKIPVKLECPSNDQIKRYLISEGVLKNYFKQEGRYWIMQR